MAYGPGGLEEAEITDLGTLSAYLGRQSVTWIDVCGLGDIDVIRRLGEIFALHHLALEDVDRLLEKRDVQGHLSELAGFYDQSNIQAMKVGDSFAPDAFKPVFRVP